MSAATLEAVPSLADVYALETTTARNAAHYLETLADVGVRRAEAMRLVAIRRQELALYVDLMAERFGHRPQLNRVEAGDDLLTELLVLAIA